MKIMGFKAQDLLANQSRQFHAKSFERYALDGISALCSEIDNLRKSMIDEIRKLNRENSKLKKDLLKIHRAVATGDIDELTKQET